MRSKSRTSVPAGCCAEEKLGSKGYFVVEVLEQVGLRWLDRLMIAAQLCGVVIFERRDECVQEGEHFAGRLIGEFGWIGKYQ
jgi:hypothetical protein